MDLVFDVPFNVLRNLVVVCTSTKIVVIIAIVVPVITTSGTFSLVANLLLDIIVVGADVVVNDEDFNHIEIVQKVV